MKPELCPKCRGTGYASIEKDGVCGVVRCDCIRINRSGRLMENKITILTTNYLDQEDLKSARKSVSYSLAERIGEPMRSRLYEMCKKIEMQGEDFRQKHKSEEHRF